MVTQSELEIKKNYIIEKLRKKNYRITSQRSLIVDTILEHECSCCKEIYYQAVKKDSTIGIATVYRMVALLEEMEVINRRNMYQIDSELEEEKTFQKDCNMDKIILFKEEKKIELPDTNWYHEMRKFLKQKGIIQNEDISIVVKVKKGC